MDKLLGDEHLEEYGEFNIDNKMSSKQGALAQIQSYDCSTKKSYHLSWNELEGYTQENATRETSWNDIFYSYIDIVEDCYIKHKHKEPIKGKDGKMRKQQNVILFLLLISTVLMLAAVKWSLLSKKDGKRVHSDTTPLLANENGV